MGLTSPTPHQLLTEAIIFGSIATIIVAGRLWACTLVNGPGTKRLQIDDYGMMLTFCFYLTLLVLIQVSARYATNLLNPADIPTVLADPAQIKDRIYGSKIVVALEQCMLASTWGVKICLLILYHRITTNLPQNIHVKAVGAYVALGYVVIQITYFGLYCQPFSQYWAFPVFNQQCATYSHYSITQAVFNLSSDALILAIPIPILLKVQLPRKSKIVLVGIFSLGVFVMLAAILNKYTNFASPLTTTYMIWYIRESSTAIYVSNIMCWWPLLRRLFGMHTFSGEPSSRDSSARFGRRASNVDVEANKDSDRGGFRGFAKRLRSTKRSSLFRPTDLKRRSLLYTEAEGGVCISPPDIRHSGVAPDRMVSRGAPLKIWRKIDVNVENSKAPLRNSTHSFDHAGASRTKYEALVSGRPLCDLG